MTDSLPTAASQPDAPRHCIGIWSPSKAVRDDQQPDVLAGEQLLRTWGWDVHYPAHWTASTAWGAAGLPSTRADDLEELIEAGCDAIMCTQGGDSANELLDILSDRLLLDRIVAAGIRFCGMSDNSLLANVIANAGGAAFLGPDSKVGERGQQGFLNDPYTQHWLGTFFETGWHSISAADSWSAFPIIDQIMRGPLVGGNLSCFMKAIGTRHWPNLDNKILLVETLSTRPGDVMCRFSHLKQIGAIDHLAGILFGRTNEIDDDTLRAMVDELTNLVGRIPIWRFGAFGHYCPHALIPLGTEAIFANGVLRARWPD